MTEPRSLRPYQQQAVDAVMQSWGNETRRTAVVLPTGTGKSTVIAQVAAESARMGLRVALLAHRGELLDQMADTVRVVAPDLPRPGIVRAEEDDSHSQIVAASFQTLASEYRLNRVGQRQVVLIDECFVAGTPVDGKPIESVRVGDFVTSWSETDARFVQRRVTRTMSSVPSALVRVSTTDGQEFVCTPGHPFLTPIGWVPAVQLSHGVQLHHANSVQAVPDSRGDHHEVPAGSDAETRVGLLHEDVLHGVPRGNQFTHHVGDEPEVRRFAYAGAQPDAQPGHTLEGIEHPPAYRASASNQGREWGRTYDASVATGNGPELGNGSSDSDDGRAASTQVRSGHRKSHAENRSGSGRTEPCCDGPPSIGCPEDFQASGPRVVGVAVLEPGSDGRYGGLCPDGMVYNLEVEEDHTYTVGSGVVVHNCHHVTANRYRAVVESFGPETFFCGFTATLRREDGKALRDMIDSVAYEKNLRWAIGEGYLVRPHGITVKIPELDLGKVKTTAGDFQQTDLAEVMEAETPEIVKAILMHAGDRRPIVFAASVQAAFDIAQLMTERGMAAEAVTGSMSYAERQPVYARYRTGETRALVTVQVLTEGADFPMCDAVVIARPTQSQNLYSQMVGRSLRLFKDKKDALVLDLVGTARVLKLVTLTNLDAGTYSKKVDTEGEELPPEDDEDMGDLGLSELREPKQRRMGPIDTIGIDLLGPDETGILWLGTEKGIPFVAPQESGFAWFLWETAPDAYKVGVMSTKGGKEGGWLEDGKSLPLTIAKDIAEDNIIEQGYAFPLRTASWRKYQPASEAQLRYARTLGIIDAETMTKARLSDEITIALISRRLDTAR